MKRRLSELIRAGSAIRPQCRGMMFAGVVNKHGVTELGSCSLGAAWEALTGFSSNWVTGEHASEELIREYPILNKLARHPLISPDQVPVAQLMTHLNDLFGWSREQIADWVETIEAEEALKDAKVDRFLETRNPEPVLA